MKISNIRPDKNNNTRGSRSAVIKVIISILLFLIPFTIMSCIVIVPYALSESKYIQDKKTRKNLAGTINYVIVDDSQGATGFDPRILDKNLGCNSYNLSNSLMTMYGRYELLKKEIERNPIDTVVLGLSCDSLTRVESEAYGDGDATTIVRFDTLGEQIHFLTSRVEMKNWLNIYARCFVEGIELWTKLATGKYESQVIPEEKGLWEKVTNDMTLSQEEAAEIKDSLELNTEFQKANIQELEEIVNLCKENNIRVICVCVPLPDGTLLSYTVDSLNQYEKKAKELCDRLGVEFYDFNLIKDREKYFNDRNCFYDVDHLSTEGAQVFSQVFCDVMKVLGSTGTMAPTGNVESKESVESGDYIDQLFFEDYGEVKQKLLTESEK